MKSATRMKFIYRFAEICWVFWAISAIAALGELGGESHRAAGMCVVAAMLYCIMGVYAAEGRLAGLEMVTSGDAPIPMPIARFVVYSAPVASALGMIAALLYMMAFKQTLSFIYIAPNVVMAVASANAVARILRSPNGPVRGGGRPPLNRPRFMIGAALLVVDAIGFAIMVITGEHTEAARTLRTAVSWTVLAATLGYLALIFRFKSYHLSKNPGAVMDAGDRPSPRVRYFLIYTAQSGVIALVINALIMCAVRFGKVDFVVLAQSVCVTSLVEAAIISLCLATGRSVKPMTPAQAYKPAPPPAAPKEEAKPGLSAKEWQKLKQTRAKAIEAEMTSGAAAQTAVPMTQAAGPLTDNISEAARRRALQARAVRAIRLYQASLEKAQRAKPPQKPEPQAKEDAAARQRALHAEQRRAQLEKEAAEAQVDLSREQLVALLNAAAARMEPRGAALATLEGQQALFRELAELLPGLNAMETSAPLTHGALPEGQDLPGAVGTALSGACDLLAKADFDALAAKWDALPPAILARGWRALKAYRSISGAAMLFDAASERIEDGIAAREDCVAWLRAHSA